MSGGKLQLIDPAAAYRRLLAETHLPHFGGVGNIISSSGPIVALKTASDNQSRLCKPFRPQSVTEKAMRSASNPHSRTPRIFRHDESQKSPFNASEPVAILEEQDLDKDSLAWRKAFVSQYECLSAEAVADESGNTAKNRSAIASRWAAEKKIFSIRYENKTLYPKFQFKDGSPISAIARVLEIFPNHFTGWDIAFFFTNPNSYLDGRKPVDLLKADPEKVVSLVHAFVRPADVF